MVKNHLHLHKYKDDIWHKLSENLPQTTNYPIQISTELKYVQEF